MRLALVGWAGDSGVGRELIDATRHLPVDGLFILPNTTKPTRHDLLPEGIPIHKATAGNLAGQMDRWLFEVKPDTILTWEVPGSWDFPAIWKGRNISWKHVVHWDWFSKDYLKLWPWADLVAPNLMCKKELKATFGLNSVYLPVPIDTERLPFKERHEARLFVSVYGYGGFHDRRSLPEIYSAWRAMKYPPALEIRAQVKPYEIEKTGVHARIEVKIGNVPEPGDLWNDADVALQPSRYEGLGLSLLEAQARGVPVIAVDAPPMDEVAGDLRVKVAGVEEISVMGKKLPSYVPSVDSLRMIVESLGPMDLGRLSRAARYRVESRFSWTRLRPYWLHFLERRKA